MIVEGAPGHRPEAAPDVTGDGAGGRIGRVRDPGPDRCG